MRETTQDTYAQDLEEAGTKHVIVDFWAPWCAPCKQMTPVLEQLETEFDQVTFLKVNVDENPNLAIQFGVRGLPTIAHVMDGTIMATRSGAGSAHTLRDWIGDQVDFAA